MYLETCSRGASDTSTRHAVFSFVAGTWRRDYRLQLRTLEIPTLIISGRDVGTRSSSEKLEATEVDKSSAVGLLKWLSIWRKGYNQKAGRFDQVSRDLGVDPKRKLRDYVVTMDAANRIGRVETALLPGWNVLVYESPRELAACIGHFVCRWFGPPSRI